MPILLLFIDYESSEYPELEGGIRVVRYMSAKRQLTRSYLLLCKKITQLRIS
jgi:hypothetical protein